MAITSIDSIGCRIVFRISSMKFGSKTLPPACQRCLVVCTCSIGALAIRTGHGKTSLTDVVELAADRMASGPPTKDAVQTVSYVKAYFNSTDHARQTAYEKRCTNPSAHNAICEIPKLSGPPDPAGRYHMSWFFTEQHNHTEGQINYVPPQ